ncbi:hypothetical protein WKW77_20070 [Variovorax ureilyticus]|uniref:Uncharacterized protein n=1 Tax=Variovorax ureilyticus TaxID=1836198 RepID=A0ABU8VK47_9BURK
MSTGYRNFVVHDDQTIEPMSQKTFTAFFFRNEPALPQFANQAINLATVFYRLKNRKPEQIIQLENQRFHVTADGSLDQDRINEAILLKMNRAGWGSSSGAPTNQGPVIDASARFDERRLAQYYPQLSGPALGRILQALFGRASN